MYVIYSIIQPHPEGALLDDCGGHLSKVNSLSCSRNLGCISQKHCDL